jgi:hypothetical protein
MFCRCRFTASGNFDSRKVSIEFPDSGSFELQRRNSIQGRYILRNIVDRFVEADIILFSILVTFRLYLSAAKENTPLGHKIVCTNVCPKRASALFNIVPHLYSLVLAQRV